MKPDIWYAESVAALPFGYHLVRQWGMTSQEFKRIGAPVGGSAHDFLKHHCRPSLKVERWPWATATGRRDRKRPATS